MGVSFWQLLIIVLIFGSPVIMYFIVAGGPKDDIQKPLRFFNWSFWVSVVGSVLIFVLAGTASNPDSMDAALAGLVLVLIVAGWAYLIALGVLAKRTGRSWILWTGLTFITSPIGMLVSYLMMRSRVASSAAES